MSAHNKYFSDELRKGLERQFTLFIHIILNRAAKTKARLSELLFCILVCLFNYKSLRNGLHKIGVLGQVP